MKKPPFALHAFAIFICCLANCIAVSAQTTATPASIKVDGKLDEWGDKLPDFNKSTGIYYAISNNDKNLYLSVQAADPIAVKKIILSGLSFSVFSSKKDNAVITFPIIYSKGSAITSNYKKKVNAARATLLEDSLSKVMNRQIGSLAKQILVNGIPGVPDTLAIYNENNINVALRFTDKRVLNYELSIPIAYIKSQINNNGELNYNIQLNGTTANDGYVTTLSADGKYITRAKPNDVPGARGTMMLELRATPELIDMIALDSPTDFTDKYTLSK